MGSSLTGCRRRHPWLGTAWPMRRRL